MDRRVRGGPHLPQRRAWTPKHNPEFTTIELYQAFTDFHGMMDLVEELYKRLALKICGSLVNPVSGQADRYEPLGAADHGEAVKKYSGVDYYYWKTDADAIACANSIKAYSAGSAHQGCDPGRVLRCLC